jgi:uncharacterized membrane protein (UPF0127 family)
VSNVLLTESGSVVASDLRPAHGIVSRTLGLMFRRPLADGEALDIRPCSSIHMMFMRFAIDAVFYDRDFRVTKVASNVRPWIGLAFGGKGTKGVIEMRSGTASSIRAGDVLVFEPVMQGTS